MMKMRSSVGRAAAVGNWSPCGVHLYPNITISISKDEKREHNDDKEESTESREEKTMVYTMFSLAAFYLAMPVRPAWFGRISL